MNDGEEIIFATTTVKDGTDKTELLQLMLKKESFDNPKFPALCEAMNYFKQTEGGREAMCKEIENLAKNLYGDLPAIIEQQKKALAEKDTALAEKDNMIKALQMQIEKMKM